MKYCQQCKKSMKRNTSTGELVFVCPRCQYETPAGDYDVCIQSMTSQEDSARGMFDIQIANAPFVREAQRVQKKCPRCFRDTMVAVRVDVHENIIYRCQCKGTEEVISTLSRT